ncbi:MAG: GAP1-N1 domain-containing protein [Panacagrimonas sp.]
MSPDDAVKEQVHGYKNGHQLLAGNIRLIGADQDLVDRLSDISGSLRPNETFAPYISCYPLPGKSHFVIARTWHDRKASRAGCVITKSLFIPMDDMLPAAIDLSSVIASLRSPPNGIEGTGQQPVFAEWKSLPVVTESWTTELAEALFLEARSPVVVFETSLADIAVLRLLAAAWPKFRCAFTACSYSLSPRTLGGHVFDLQFAPSTSRSRFAEVTCRKVDAAAESVAPRHRWSHRIAERLFLSSQPSLREPDELGLLQGNDADESAFRMTWLWDELSSKAQSSPTAVLGMLDVLNATDVASRYPMDTIADRVRHAVALNDATPQLETKWQFLLALAGKFPSRRPPLSALKAIRSAAAKIVQEHPQPTLATVLEGDEIPPRMIWGGVADGLASAALNDDDFIHLLTRAGPKRSAKLLDASKQLTNRLFSATAANASLAKALSHSFLAASNQERSRAIARAGAEIRSPSQAILLDALLTGDESATILVAIEKGERSGAFKVPELVDTVAQAIASSSKRREIRDGLLRELASADQFQLLSRVLQPSPSDVDALCDTALARGTAYRIQDLIAAIIEKSDDTRIRDLLSEPTRAERLLSIFAGGGDHHVDGFVKLLMLSESVPPALVLKRGLILLQSTAIGRDTKQRLRRELLKKALSAASEQGLPVRETYWECATAVDGRTLVDLLVPYYGQPLRCDSILEIVGSALAETNRSLLEEIEEFSKRLCRVGVDRLNAGSIDVWANLIASANKANHRGAVAAASQCVDAALRVPWAPSVSRLMVTCTPIVYRELEEDRPTPSLMEFVFLDWDKCKSIRHKVVDTYVTSKWPAIDLLEIAVEIGESIKMLRRVMSSVRGSDYLRRIEDEVMEAPEAVRSRLSAALDSQAARTSKN